MRQQLVTSIIAIFVVVGVPAFSHHSFVAAYLEGEESTIEGEVSRFLLRNPHSFLFVSVEGDTGQAQEWIVEWASLNQLDGQNITSDTVRPGDHVVVTGDPSRMPGEPRLLIRTIQRPSDGWSWGGEVD